MMGPNFFNQFVNAILIGCEIAVFPIKKRFYMKSFLLCMRNELKAINLLAGYKRFFMLHFSNVFRFPLCKKKRFLKLK